MADLKDQTKNTQMYCVKCKDMKLVIDPEHVTLKNGRPAHKGKCPHCNTATFKIVKKDS